MTAKQIVDHALISAAVDKYASFLEENWEDQSVLNCALLIRTLGVQHKLMCEEIARLRGGKTT